MLCQNCGRMIGNGNFCPHCGAPVGGNPVQVVSAAAPAAAAPVQPAPAAEAPMRQMPDLNGKFKTVFGDKLLLAVAILETLSVLCLFSGGIFGVLFAIGLWVAYGAAKSKKPTFSQTGIKMISGTIKAQKILMWITIGLYIALTVLVVIALTLLPQLVPVIEQELGGSVVATAGFALIFFAVAMAMVIAMLILFAIFFYGKLHKFAKSICVSAATGKPVFVKAKAARQWLFVLGIIGCVSTTISLASFLSTYAFANDLTYAMTGIYGTAAGMSSVLAASVWIVVANYVASLAAAAAMIIASRWIKKYFPDC